MAPLSPSNTPRFRVFYTNVAQQHVQEYRSHVSPSALGTLVDGFWTALAGGISATTIDEVQWAPTGSNIFNPVTTGIEGNAYGSGSGVAGGDAWYYSFIGRSSGGRRLRLYFFGGVSTANDYRFVAGEDALIDAVIAALQAAGSDLRCIDDLAPVWKSYANAGVSAYWQKRDRP